MKVHYLFTNLVIVAISSLSLTLNAKEDNPYRQHRQAAIGSAAGVPWSSVRHLELVEKANAMRSQLVVQKKTYPISEEELRQIYLDNQTTTIPFFAYSSMIDKEAAAVKAISSEAAATQTPAIAFGMQRTFNRELAAATVEGGWGTLNRPNDVAILNIFQKEDAVLNGMIFDLPLSDLLILSKREVGYDLIPVFTTRWDAAVNEQNEPEVFLAYTFQAPSGSGEGIHYTNPNVNPIPGYFTYLQKGLNLQGDGFKAMWWATTYLADQETLVNELPYRPIDLKGTSASE
jgi:hypothetical protein